jgi:hypothetical protein
MKENPQPNKPAEVEPADKDVGATPLPPEQVDALDADEA